MFKGVENFKPGLKLYIRQRNTKKTYKGKTYQYQYCELIQTYRDPNNKTKVVSKFIGFLGKKSKQKEHLEKMRRRLTGHYTVHELTSALGQALKPGEIFSPTTELTKE